MDWQARWIWKRGRTRKEFDFAYFRHTFEVPAECAARIHCAADSKYRLWLNGEYMGFGPARGLPERPYYDSHRVRLTQGRNTVAFLVEHYTRPSGRDPSGRIFPGVHSGLLCQVEAGGGVLAATGRAWRALASEAYSPLPGLLLPEAFDARLEPEDWFMSGFDDSDWPIASEPRESGLAAPGDLVPRPIPIIRERCLRPERLVDVGTCRDEECSDLLAETDIASSLWRCKLGALREDAAAPSLQPGVPWTGKSVKLKLRAGESIYLSLDFGLNTLASPEVCLKGPDGIVLDMGYSECLNNNRVATRWQGHRESERIILRKGRTHHRINQPRGFRYMMLRLTNLAGKAAAIVLEDVTAHEAIYPAVERGRFQCSNPLMESIYRLSARTVNLCMEDAYTDCPWRERSQWLGDLQPEALFSYYCFGSYDIARKATLEFARGNTEEGWLPGVYPTRRPSNLPTWGMRFPVIGWEYYMFTGDRDALPEIYESVRKQMDWLKGFENRDALLVDVPAWCFVDWTSLDAHNNEGVVQGWYLEALDHSAMLARELGKEREAAGFEGRAERLRKALAKAYWSSERKAFLKYRAGSTVRPRSAAADLIGQHENFLFCLLKVGTPAMRRQALRAVAGPTGGYLPNLGDYQSSFARDQKGNYCGEHTILIGSPFWSFYALLALMEAGKVQESIDYIRLGWGLMLEHGATSCWEMWDRHTSLCHGWSAAPAMILPAYVLGVQPIKPGFARFEVRPRTGNLTWAKGRVPTPHGAVDVSWRKGEDGTGFTCEVSVPGGTVARFVPRDVSLTRPPTAMTVDGADRGRPGAVTLPAGKHVVALD